MPEKMATASGDVNHRLGKKALELSLLLVGFTA
jgi:hypothetical protein